ncbi:MAG: trypsin-like peptidase domain-containing protein [Nocardioides sp.]
MNDTQVFPAAQPPSPLPSHGALPSGPPKPKRATAGLLAAALLAGGAGGFGGAAAWNVLQPTPTSSSSTTATKTSSTEEAPSRADASIEAVAAKVLPSVVQIDVTDSEGAGSGSGVVLTEDGLILTNNHVVELVDDAGEVSVSFNDGRKSRATIIGTDPKTDSAVIQATDMDGLVPAEIGDSAALEVGQDVVAIGSPYGLDATVTSGIVSALNRPVSVDDQATYPAIQTDASINPGNSGGPLVDLNGRVVGINSSIRGLESADGEAGSIGLGFAIPIDELMPIVDQLVAGETPTHAQLGISVGPAPADADAAGALVVDVAEGSGAEGAGLQIDDIITRLDDRRITGVESLIATVRSFRPSDEVLVTYVRDGQEETTTLTLGSDAD